MPLKTRIGRFERFSGGVSFPVILIHGVLAVVVAFGSCPFCLALDTGLLDNYLNVNMDCPVLGDSIGADAARQAVEDHVRDVLTNQRYRRGPSLDYWNDYRSVLGKYQVISRALPVFVGIGENRTDKVARFLVGFEDEDRVLGFIAVDASDGSILSELMWNSRLEPLWNVPADEWNSAESVNDIDELAELVPPYAQFTTGIPVNPEADGVFIVDDVVDMPYKTQEERTAWCEWFNENYGTKLDLTLDHTLGRRTATSKCLSFSISFLSDWWTWQTGGRLGSYVNGAGGQKEYGFNPRLFEALYFKRAMQEAGIGGRLVQGLGKLIGVHMYALGQFKLVGKDRVTGEPIAYSPRGYARVATEARACELEDPLVGGLVRYSIGDNEFSMDRPPLPIVLDAGLLARITDTEDAEDFDEKSGFSRSKWTGTVLEGKSKDAVLKEALDDWGVLYAQHIKRTASGEAERGLFATGVHACLLVGYCDYRDETHFIYKETFGRASHRYLEDSFLGPSFRMMPARYFWQVIAFPHHLYVSIDMQNKGVQGFECDFSVTTNRRTRPIEPDQLAVFIDGKRSILRIVPTSLGSYRIAVPQVLAKEVEVRVYRKYFSDRLGRKVFRSVARRVKKFRGYEWKYEELEPMSLQEAGFEP